ncbi:hypothetical protein POKO110462_12235 [Pontibacter korlensis]|uniref:S9 family peptidase n=1 Tax=Pontibacter korlensis TaxID=400092 RepID=A0A0E3ZDK5_9BACT|nr:hypothetical protein [Pontibacter korlensis]AKD02485.1 hypothetical protein PKOR_04330 [Pontibacter korlensis]
MKKQFILSFILLCLLCQPQAILAQSKTRASVDFSYNPDPEADHFNQRLPDKSIPVGQNELVLLNRTDNSKYTVEKYSAELKKVWSVEIPLEDGETVDKFTANNEAVLVITNRKAGQNQQLYGHRINLQAEKKEQPVLLLEAPAKSRRAGVAISEDGSQVLAYRFHTDNSFQIQSISGSLFNGNLQKQQDVKYDLSDLRGILTADIQLGNGGEQYVSLISDQMNRLSVRQFKPGRKEAKVMSVLVGGVFDGLQVYIRDTRFKLMEDGLLYGAVLTADEKSGGYYSLKAVKYDFENEDMVFAEEFKFSPDYVQKINALDKSNKGNRLQDISLSELLLTPEKKLVILAEKKYTEGGENAPYFAEELHLFAYDEYMGYDWNSVLTKQQQAPAAEGFTSISYSSHLSGNTLNLLTLEELNGKYDLYLRQINTSNGSSSAPQALRLNVANDKKLAYVKDYTVWLAPKDIVTVVRAGKKPDQLQLSRIEIK